jgi:carbon monoxide dehydrogenase subunit G
MFIRYNLMVDIWMLKSLNKENQMLLKGDVTIRAPRKQVWDFLTDPNLIGQCAPGVEKIEVIEPMKRYRGVVSVGLGGVKARFNGDVEVLELNEPNHAKLKAHGTAAGSVADALSEMSLSDGPDGATSVHWTADVNVSGQLASLAARLMMPVSQKLASQFYEKVREKIEAGNKSA